MSKATFEDLNKDLNYFEEAEIYLNLMKTHNLTQEGLALEIGKDQSTVANRIRLLRLAPTVKKVLLSNNISAKHARTLLKLHDEQLQLKVLRLVCERKLTVAEMEEIICKACKTEAKKDLINTVKKAVTTAKNSGVKIETQQVDMGDYIKIVVHIRK